MDGSSNDKIKHPSPRRSFEATDTTLLPQPERNTTDKPRKKKMLSARTTGVQPPESRANSASDGIRCGGDVVVLELATVQDLPRPGRACICSEPDGGALPGSRTRAQSDSSAGEIFPAVGSGCCCVQGGQGAQATLLRVDSDGATSSATISSDMEGKGGSSGIEEKIFGSRRALASRNTGETFVGELRGGLSIHGLEKTSPPGRIRSPTDYEEARDGATVNLRAGSSVFQLPFIDPSTNVQRQASSDSGGPNRLHGSDRMEGPIDPCLVQGDLAWADNDFVECIFEEFPFLREVEFKALPSPSDFFIFQSGNRVLGYYQEACAIYFLGHSLHEAHRGFEQIKRCGWGQSPFLRVDDETGEVQDDGIGLGGQTVVITKTPAEYKTVDDLCAAINQSIEENTLIWPNVKSTAVENVRKEILEIPDLNCVQSLSIFIYPAGLIATHSFRREDDERRLNNSLNMTDITKIFSNTLNSDPAVRASAEHQIGQVEATPGVMTMVMQIVSSPDTPSDTRQAVAVYFKNRVQRCWDLKEDATDESSRSSACAIPVQDRTNIRNNILEALVHAPSLVRPQLTVCLSTILTYDHPELWPEFVPQVQALLSSNDMRLVSGGIVAVSAIMKIYQWKNPDKRGPLYTVVEQLFPLTLSIGSRLVQESSGEAADMLRLILKGYHASMQTDLSDIQRHASSLVPWGTLFTSVVEKPILNEVLPEEQEDRERCPWWRTKKWAFNCLNLLFCRYGNPALLPGSSRNKPPKDPKNARDILFAKEFVNNFAPGILRVYLTQADLYVQGKRWISSLGLFSMASFFSDCVKHNVTWQLLKPHVEVLVSHLIFPMLCFQEKDEELWQEDAVQYVQKKLDPMDDYQSPVSASINLLIDLAKDRRKHTFSRILQFANQALMKYLSNPEDVMAARQKDGALCMVGSLCDVVLSKKSPIQEQMEQFFLTHVFPEFRSKYPFLRSRACDLVVRYSDMTWKNENNLLVLCQNVGHCLHDAELPVRVQAALTLIPLLQHDNVREAMKESAPAIMQELLNLTNQIDIGTLSDVMETFVETFAEQLTPFAVQLAVQLRDTFLRIMSEVQAQTDVDPETFGNIDCDEARDKTMAAMGVMKTVGTLIISLEHSPEVLKELEEVLLPIVQFVLGNNILELFDEAFEILDSLTFSSNHVSPVMWSAFELVYTAFKSSGPDFMEGMLPSLDNYISYGKDMFMTSPQVQAMVLDMIASTLQNDHVRDQDYIGACKLMESVLLNCRGGVDAFVPKFLELIFGHVMTGKGPKTKPFLVYCLQVVANCFYYNARLTLQYMDMHNWSAGFFDLWTKNFDVCTRVHDKRLIISTLCALLELPDNQQTQSLREYWPRLLEGLVVAFKTLPAAIEKRKEVEKLYKEDNDEEEEDDKKEYKRQLGGEAEEGGDQDDWNDDEDVQSEDNEYLEFLASQVNQHAPSEDVDTDDESTYDGEDLMEEEVMFESPLDDVDVYVRFQDVFRGLQQTNASTYAYLTGQLAQEHQALLHSVLSTADANRTAKAASAST